jgi:hypothetical protein
MTHAYDSRKTLSEFVINRFRWRSSLDQSPQPYLRVQPVDLPVLEPLETLLPDGLQQRPNFQNVDVIPPPPSLTTAQLKQLFPGSAFQHLVEVKSLESARPWCFIRHRCNTFRKTSIVSDVFRVLFANLFRVFRCSRREGALQLNMYVTTSANSTSKLLDIVRVNVSKLCVLSVRNTKLTERNSNDTTTTMRE